MHLNSDVVRSHVDIENGVAGRIIFVDEDIYKHELESIFAHTWLFLGHEDQIPNPDDYYVTRMGEEQVILTRDRQGEIHALLNSCTHRGMKLCRYDEGNTSLFTCPYHAWSFSTDGSLVSRPGDLFGVPGYKTRYFEELDKSKWGLIAVPRIANFHGTIWGNWDPEAPSFEEYLGGMGQWLRFALESRDGRPGQGTVLAGIQKWRVKCNWKFAPTNFSGDFAHAVSHRSVDMVNIGPSGVGRRDDKFDGASVFGWPDLGHGGTGWAGALEEDYVQPKSFQRFPEVAEWFDKCRAERRQRLRDTFHFQGKGTIFPNMSFHEEQPRTIIVAHPNGPGETEFWRYYLVDRDAPDHVKDTLRRYFMSYSGPAGLTEQDDLENWAAATEASNGTISRQYPYNYQQGLGHSVPYPDVPGCVWAGQPFSEQNQVIFLKRWAEFMEGRNWDQLMHRVEIPGDVEFPLAKSQTSGEESA
ncbi:Rieske 2Fe-2S domain-containing protein [Micromonospora sp. NPDC048830]|uniref:aromatic ring-hydroxylating oxygenase subunit alpha n=1 Tax=Micromonospora sp. NPDC048830 TaxID=3364257 RepID=UPI00371CDAA4